MLFCWLHTISSIESNFDSNYLIRIKEKFACCSNNTKKANMLNLMLVIDMGIQRMQFFFLQSGESKVIYVHIVFFLSSIKSVCDTCVEFSIVFFYPFLAMNIRTMFFCFKYFWEKTNYKPRLEVEYTKEDLLFSFEVLHEIIYSSLTILYIKSNLYA